VPRPPELPPTPRTSFYSPLVLERGLEKFEREGLWLLLSLHHYGWRARADMAAYRAGDGFLRGYRRYGGNVASEFNALREMTGDDWRVIFGMPTDARLSAVLAERGVEEEIEEARALRDDVLATTHRNMEEIGVFFARTEPVDGQEGRS
jgi:hypothetical protein